MNLLVDRRQNPPIRRAHLVGTSVVVTIDPTHVRRLGIDEWTFFIQKGIDNGIVLEMRKLTIDSGEQNISNSNT
ncbi:MAG: hypothetical protein ACRD5J_19515 [Nitrososphaeraceae archaeon]